MKRTESTSGIKGKNLKIHSAKKYTGGPLAHAPKAPAGKCCASLTKPASGNQHTITRVTSRSPQTLPPVPL